MFTHKKWFSFLEMLIVIMIVSVLFVAFRSSFQIKSKDVLYGQACIETVYGQVNNFMHAWLSSKSIYTGNTTIFPDQYSISFNPVDQKILLSYKKQNSGYIYNSIEFSWNTNIMYCNSNSYTIKLTWDSYEIHINKGLQENSALQAFYISGTNSVSTWWNTFLQCENLWTWCKTMARFEVDTRTIGLKKQMCFFFSDTGDCLEWDN